MYLACIFLRDQNVSGCNVTVDKRLLSKICQATSDLSGVAEKNGQQFCLVYLITPASMRTYILHKLYSFIYWL